MSDNTTKKSGAAKLGSLTSRELELAAIVFQCFDGPFPKVNYEKMAELAGFKNSQSASACWGPVKKKLMALGEAAANKAGDTDNDGADSGGPATPKAKATPRKRKTKAELAAENGDAAAPPSAKKPRAKKAAPAKAAPAPVPAVDNDDQDGDDEEALKDEEEDTAQGI